MLKVGKILNVFKPTRNKGATLADLTLGPFHPVNIYLADKSVTTLISYHNDSEIIIYPKHDTTDLASELQVGDNVPVLIPQSFGAFHGLSRVKSITGSGHTLITLELCGTLSEKEDRQFYRLPISVNIDYSLQVAASQAFMQSRTIDLSPGGIRLYVLHSVPVDSALNLSFDLTDGSAKEHFLVPAKVKHTYPQSGKDAVGVQFIDIPEAKQEFITNFIAAQYEQQVQAETHRAKYIGAIGPRRPLIEYEKAVQIFLRWCRKRQVRPSWVILYDLHEFRGWLEIKGYSEAEINCWIEHIVNYL